MGLAESEQQYTPYDNACQVLIILYNYVFLLLRLQIAKICVV